MWPVERRMSGECDVADDAPDETALIAAAQADPHAFDTLYRRYLPRIYRYTCAQTANAEDAADLTQQIFLQALDALPAYRARGLPFAAWLFRIARNAVIDAHRRRRHSALAWETLPEALHTSSSDNDPETLLLRRESLGRLHELLAALDGEKRELLALRFAGQLSSSEIATVVGKSPAAVKKQLTRLIQALKEQYHDAR